MSSSRAFLQIALDDDTWETDLQDGDWTLVGSIREAVVRLSSEGGDGEATGADSQIVVHDPDRKLDPTNPSSPWASQLHLRREARIRTDNISERIVDSFTRADSPTAMGSTEGESPRAWAATGDNWGIIGGKAYRSSGSATHRQATIDTGQADHTVSAAIEIPNGEKAGLVAHFADANNFVLLEVHMGGNVEVFRKNAGSYTSVAVAATGPVSGERWGLQVNEGTVVVYRNGENVWQGTPTPLPVGSKAGFHTANDVGTGARFHSFVAQARPPDRVIWRGYVDDFVWSPKEPHDTTMQATDIMGVLAELSDAPTPYERLTEAEGPIEWYPLGEPNNPNEADGDAVALNKGVSKIHGFYGGRPDRGQESLLTYDGGTSVNFRSDGSNPILIPRMMSAATLGVFPGEVMAVEVWMRAKPQIHDFPCLRLWRDLGTGEAFQLVLLGNTHISYPGRLEVRYGDTLTTVAISSIRVDDDRSHMVVFQYEPGAGGHIYVDGVERTTAGGFTVGSGANGRYWALGHSGALETPDVSFQHLATYKSDIRATIDDRYNAGAGRAAELSGARMERILDHAGVPAWLRIVNPGREEVVGHRTGDALVEEIGRVADTEEGIAFAAPTGEFGFEERTSYPTPIVWTLDNLSGIKFSLGNPSSRSKFLANEVRLTRVNGIRQEAVDPGSRNRHGPRQLQIDNLLHLNDLVVLDSARRRLAQRKGQSNLIAEVAIDWRLGHDEAYAAQTAVIGDGVRVVLRPKVGPSSTMDMRIVGVTHEIRRGGAGMTRWALAPPYPGYVPSVRVRSATPQTIPDDGLWHTIGFDLERWDNDNMHSTVGVPFWDRLVAQTAGEYLIGGQVDFAGGPAGTVYGLGIILNGATFLAIDNEIDSPTPRVQTAWKLDVNDYVELMALVNPPSGPALATFIGNAYSPEFWAAKIS